MFSNPTGFGQSPNPTGVVWLFLENIDNKLDFSGASGGGFRRRLQRDPWRGLTCSPMHCLYLHIGAICCRLPQLSVYSTPQYVNKWYRYCFSLPGHVSLVLCSCFLVCSCGGIAEVCCLLPLVGPDDPATSRLLREDLQRFWNTPSALLTRIPSYNTRTPSRPKIHSVCSNPFFPTFIVLQ